MACIDSFPMRPGLIFGRCLQVECIAFQFKDVPLLGHGHLEGRVRSLPGPHLQAVQRRSAPGTTSTFSTPPPGRRLICFPSRSFAETVRNTCGLLASCSSSSWAVPSATTNLVHHNQTTASFHDLRKVVVSKMVRSFPRSRINSESPQSGWGPARLWAHRESEFWDRGSGPGPVQRAVVDLWRGFRSPDR